MAVQTHSIVPVPGVTASTLTAQRARRHTGEPRTDGRTDGPRHGRKPLASRRPGTNKGALLLGFNVRANRGAAPAPAPVGRQTRVTTGDQAVVRFSRLVHCSGNRNRGRPEAPGKWVRARGLGRAQEQSRQQGRRTQRLVGLVQTDRTHTGDFWLRLGASGWFPGATGRPRCGLRVRLGPFRCRESVTSDDSERSWTSVPVVVLTYLATHWWVVTQWRWFRPLCPLVLSESRFHLERGKQKRWCRGPTLTATDVLPLLRPSSVMPADQTRCLEVNKSILIYYHFSLTKALFITVALLFVFDKYCLIMD
jgi:hypothetical protein